MWWWLLIWASLLVAAGVYLGARGWGLWGQTKELGAELVIAQQRLDDVQGQLELLGEQITVPEQLAVFAPPASARKQRDLAKAAGRHARHQRRAAAGQRRADHDPPRDSGRRPRP